MKGTIVAISDAMVTIKLDYPHVESNPKYKAPKQVRIVDELPSSWQNGDEYKCDVFFSDEFRSPIVRGTWVTVQHVVSLIRDDWTWGDILRCHPELTEDDLRACLAYSIEEDGRPAPR